MRAEPTYARLNRTARELLDLIALKISRIVTGDPAYEDNWHDIAGYAKLGEDRCKQIVVGDAKIEVHVAGSERIRECLRSYKDGELARIVERAVEEMKVAKGGTASLTSWTPRRGV